jgi:uncharacterized protein (DUF305 family)
MERQMTIKLTAGNQIRIALAAVIALLFGVFSVVLTPSQSDASPASGGSCQEYAATPTMGDIRMGDGGMMSATPDAHAMGAMPEFDLAYIDMMIPHHESVIALAEVALPELNDPRLIEIAEAIIATQTVENDMMRELRSEWYGDAATVSMEGMMDSMPGMDSDMARMNQQMDSGWQVSNFCSAESKDLAFVDRIIPHHQMAIDVSEDAVERATHPELIAIAEAVIVAQKAEIDLLLEIRVDLGATATPEG